MHPGNAASNHLLVTGWPTIISHSTQPGGSMLGRFTLPFNPAFYFISHQQALTNTMLCSRCTKICFKPLLSGDDTYVYYVLHPTRSSYSISISQRCQLCTLISSQLGTVTVKNSTCAQLSAFLVLKRRRTSTTPLIQSMPTIRISIISQIGCGSLTAINSLPGKIFHNLRLPRCKLIIS